MALVTGSLQQIILYVQDMTSEVQFYRDVLGLTISYPKNITDYSLEMWVTFETGGCTLALHGGVTEPPSEQHEIVFSVEDINKAQEIISAAGIEIGSIRTLEDGALIAQGRDPAGHRFAIRSPKV
jgi:predicted enzyme related to lactoylglutathione lyase